MYFICLHVTFDLKTIVDPLPDRSGLFYNPDCPDPLAGQKILYLCSIVFFTVRSIQVFYSLLNKCINLSIYI